MAEYNEETQRAKVTAGFKGDGKYFKSPNLAPAMTFVDGVPAEVKSKLMNSGDMAQGKIEDPWYSRR